MQIMQMFSHLFEQILAVLVFLFTTLEGASFVLTLIYVILGIMHKKSAWLFAILASLAYGYTCWTSELYLTAGLQIFFILMSVYGFINWQNQKNINSDNINSQNSQNSQQIQQTNKIYSLKIVPHLAALALSFVLYDAISYAFYKMDMPYQNKIEIYAVAASLIAQFLQAKSYRENWLWWIVINILYVFINYNAQLYWMAGLYIILVFLSMQGFWVWRSLNLNLKNKKQKN